VYIPPEYYRLKRYSPLPATVWSLGCLVHCLIVGDGPFTDRTQVREYHGLQWPDKRDELARDFVDRCMMRDERERLSVEELLAHRWFNEPEINPSLT
jgi:serine/threonine protein kinase